jgi:hypothetical protein
MQAGHLNQNHECPTVQAAMQESLQMTLRNETIKSGGTNNSSSPSEFPTHKAHILVFPCPVIAARYSFQSLSSFSLKLDFSQSKPLIQSQNGYGPLFRLRIRSFISVKGAMHPNFNIIQTNQPPRCTIFSVLLLVV